MSEFLDPHPISDSIARAAKQRESELQKTRAETPSQFTVGGSFDGHRIEGGVSYDRKWSNLWGATAYAKAWWEDAPVVPDTHHIGYVVGAELTRKF